MGVVVFIEMGCWLRQQGGKWMADPLINALCHNRGTPDTTGNGLVPDSPALEPSPDPSKAQRIKRLVL